MSHFVIVAYDVADSAGARDAARDAHFAHIERHIEAIAIAGPLKDAGGTNTGSLFVLFADSEAEAEAVFRADPYFAAGVWGRWEVHPFLPAAGEWVGGKIW